MATVHSQPSADQKKEGAWRGGSANSALSAVNSSPDAGIERPSNSTVSTVTAANLNDGLRSQPFHAWEGTFLEAF